MNSVVIVQGLASIFCNWPDGIYFRICGSLQSLLNILFMFVVLQHFRYVKNILNSYESRLSDRFGIWATDLSDIHEWRN